MKKNTWVALTTLTILLGSSLVSYAADNKPEKSEHSHMNGDCGPMPEGSEQAMHKGWGKEGHDEWRGKRRGGDFHEHMAKILNLTDAQQKTLDEYKEKQKAVMEPLMGKHKAAHEALRKAVDSNADDATITKLANDAAVIMAQLDVLRIKARKQFVSILTTEQKQKLTEMDTNPHHRHHH